MRAVKVNLGGEEVTLRIPVPRKIFVAFKALETTDPHEQIVAGAGIFAAHAVEGWNWPSEPEAAWDAMWDSGVSVKEAQAAIQAWVQSCNAALGVEVAKKEEETFPDEPPRDGDHHP